MQTTQPSNQELLQWIAVEQKKHIDAYRALEALKQIIQPKENTQSETPKPTINIPKDIHWGC